MKWMVVCLYLSSCGCGYKVDNYGTFESEDDCHKAETQYAKQLQDRHKEGGARYTFSFRCVEINP